MSEEKKGERYIPIGKVVGVHGVHGNVKLLYFSHLKAFPYPALYLQEEDGVYRRLEVTCLSPLKGTLILRLEGIATRTEAQALVGRLVYYPRQGFIPAKRDEYYWIDLIGMTVIEPPKTMSGKVKGMIETGGTDVMVIEFEGKEYLVPFSLNWTNDISIETKCLILKEGTLEFFDVH